MAEKRESSTCVVCEHVNENVPVYGDWICSNCRQQYEYNEGHCIVLSSEQRRLLRVDAAAKEAGGNSLAAKCEYLL